MRQKLAFTLIEMVIVIAIIGVVSSIVITTLSANRIGRELDRHIHVLAGTLREAQNYALTGRSADLNQENCYFGLRFVDDSQYQLLSYYRSSGNCDNANVLMTTNLRNFGAEPALTGMASFPFVLAFSLPRAEVYSATSGAFASLASPQLVGITHAGQARYLCLYPSGRLEVRGTEASCP